MRNGAPLTLTSGTAGCAAPLPLLVVFVFVLAAVAASTALPRSEDEERLRGAYSPRLGPNVAEDRAMEGAEL